MQPEPGPVLLVGAGPGPADLMTVRAVRAVESAQALLYDALVHEEVLSLAPASCLRIQTGKRAGKASMNQATINRLMLRLARRGLRVVRLKGGRSSAAAARSGRSWRTRGLRSRWSPASPPPARPPPSSPSR
jgi:uroporphyrin-III C-methyltransferase